MLPEAFLSRMEKMLGDAYPSFLAEISAEKPKKAVRVNTKKITPEDFIRVAPFPLSPIPFSETGFYCDETGIGAYPCHHAGMIYAQDPSAIATVSAVKVAPGDRVFDMCAAPGGKTTQIAAMLGENGVIVANEMNPSRAKALVGNIERLGVDNAIVTNCDARVLCRLFHAVFDLVLLDAPCSGEGMIRKYEAAGEEWSEENVRRCALRQAELLSLAADTVRPGGTLLYSTCTFSIEENEKNIDDFLSAHPEYALVPVPEALSLHTAPGISFPGCRTADIGLCRRFYPHISPGEGQFIAVMRRAEGEDSPLFSYRDASRAPTKQEEKCITDFLRENTEGLPPHVLRMIGERPVMLPHDFPIPPQNVFTAGVLLGEIRKNLFVPHHHFFMAYGRYMKRKIYLTDDMPSCAAYLHGEEIAVDTEDGYAAVLYNGVPLGGAKVKGGRAKNHYPKGLRIK